MPGLPFVQFSGTQLEVPAGPSGVGGSAQAALPAVPGRTNYLTGWEITWGGDAVATTSDTLFVTVGATTLQYRFATVLAVGGALSYYYPSAVPAFTSAGLPAPNTAVTVGISAVGNRASVAIVAHGFLL